MKTMAGLVAARLLEQLADAGGTEAGEHLDEGGGALVSRSSRSRRAQRPWPAASCLLPEARKAGSLGHSRAETAGVPRMLEEVDDFLELSRFLDACDVLQLTEDFESGSTSVGFTRGMSAREMPEQVDDETEEDKREPQQGDRGDVRHDVDDGVHAAPIGGTPEALKQLT